MRFERSDFCVHGFWSESLSEVSCGIHDLKHISLHLTFDRTFVFGPWCCHNRQIREQSSAGHCLLSRDEDIPIVRGEASDLRAADRSSNGASEVKNSVEWGEQMVIVVYMDDFFKWGRLVSRNGFSLLNVSSSSLDISLSGYRNILMIYNYVYVIYIYIHVGT